VTDISYNIYYSRTAGGPWTLANPTPLSHVDGGNSYTVTDLQPGILYYFVIIGGTITDGEFIPLISQHIGPKSLDTGDINSLRLNTISVKTFAPHAQTITFLGHTFTMHASTDGSLGMEFGFVNPEFKATYSNNGIAQLSNSLTINSITESPTFVYEGKNATVPTWIATIGNNLASASTGTDPTPEQGTPFIDETDKGVLFNNGKVYAEAGTTFGDVGTDDIVFEVVFRCTSGITSSFVCKRDSASNDGWVSFINTSNQLVFNIDDGTASINVTSGVLTPGAWYHAAFFGDRSGSGQWYINGTASGSAASLSGAANTLDVVAPLVVGALREDFINKSQDIIVYLALWHRGAWLDTHLQATVSMDRFSRVSGILAELATSSGVPTTMTRSTSAYLDKLVSGVRNLYRVGENWLRVVSREDDEATAIVGLLAERTRTNLILQSEDFATTWSPLRASVLTNSTTAPNGFSTADTIHEDGTAADTHYITQNFNQTSGVTYTWSIWVKAINRNVIRVQAQSSPIAYATFDISTETVVTSLNTLSAKLEPYGNGWYRANITYIATATSAQEMFVFLADDSANLTFDGLDQDGVYLWGAQVEATRWPSSYIPTTTGTAPRSADVLKYASNIGNDGTMEVDLLLSDADSTEFHYPVSAYEVANRNNNRIDMFVHPTSDAISFEIKNGGVGSSFGPAAPTDIVDGVIHTAKLRWGTFTEEVYVDNNLEGTLALTPPTTIDEISVGGDRSSSSTNQVDGILSNVRVFNTSDVSL
jgi:hypothetical protein